MTKIANDKLPQNRPLWDLHIMNYPTAAAAATVVLKLHHALGDGYSLMGAIFSCVRRADDPSRPLTFPHYKPRGPGTAAAAVGKEAGKASAAWRSVRRGVAVGFNTVRDFGWSLLKSNALEDGRSALRSGVAGVEFLPVEISAVAFAMEDIKRIKDKLGAVSISSFSGFQIGN